MAKLTGPLFSVSASGKIADSLVYFGWKGLNVVRQWVVPTNKMSSDQGDVRIMLGGTGRAVGTIQAGKAFAQQMIDLGLITGVNTKQSFLVKYILDHFVTGSTSYVLELSNCTHHTSYSAFGNAANTMTITEFDLDYAAIAPYDKALGLYLIARTAIALAFTGTPYTTNITAWVTADVNGMINDFTSAT